MKRIILPLFTILLLLSIARADFVPTTTGWIWTNITFDNRTLVDWDYHFDNVTGGILPTISNLERKEFFAVFRYIPMPDDVCYHNNEACPLGTWNTEINLSYSRPGYKPSFWGGDKYTSGWGGAIIDMSSCWNWWAGENYAKRMALQRDCPVVAIKVDDYVEALNTFTPQPQGSPSPDYTVKLLGFSANYVNLDDTMSSGIAGFIDSLTDFQDIILDFWRIAYFTGAVLIIIVDIVMVIGILPLGLRWVVKKITGD